MQGVEVDDSLKPYDDLSEQIKKALMAHLMLETRILEDARRRSGELGVAGELPLEPEPEGAGGAEVPAGIEAALAQAGGAATGGALPAV